MDIYLSSASNATPGASLSIQGQNVNFNEPFPSPGKVESYPLPISSPANGDLTIGFIVDNEELQVIIKDLDYNGSLSFLSLSNRNFLGGVLHDTNAAGCIVTCKDGTKGTNCVVCAGNGIRAKVCC